MEKLIVLDRDGVINLDSDNYIKTVDEWQPEEGSIEAIARLTSHGFKIIVATNQSGISRGYYSHQTLNEMHNKLRQLCAEQGGKISAIIYCPHGPDDNCSCRKPNSGLFTKMAEYYQTSLCGVYTIGDSYRDLEAGIKVSVKPILVLTGKGKKTLAEKATELKAHNIPIKNNLLDAVEYVCSVG